MLIQFIRRVAGSLCLIFAGVVLFAILNVVDFASPLDLVAAVILALVLVVLPAWLGFWFLDLGPTTPEKSTPQAVSSQPPPPPPPVPESDEDELEVDVLQLARKKGGRLTVLEVVTELEVGVDEAEAVLEDLQVRGVAGILVSDSGLIVYSFHELQHLDEKDSAKPVTPP